MKQKPAAPTDPYLAGVTVKGTVAQDRGDTFALLLVDVIDEDGGRLKYNAAGAAKLHPKDTYDLNVGRKMALGRALKELGETLEREAWEGVK